MKTVRVTIDVSDPATRPVGRIDARRVDATTEEDLARQQAQDDAEAWRTPPSSLAECAAAWGSAKPSLPSL